MSIEVRTDEQRDSPTLIMVRGVPGGGKSYVAAKLRESIGENQVVILDPDAIDQASDEYTDFSKSLTLENVDAKLHPYRFLRSRAHQGIAARKTIIWNQGFIDLDGFGKTVNNLQAYAAEHGLQLPTLVVEVEIDSNVAKQRVANRAAQGGHDVPEEAFGRFIGNYVSFSDKGYTTVTVRGEDDVNVSVAAITKALGELR